MIAGFVFSDPAARCCRAWRGRLNALSSRFHCPWCLRKDLPKQSAWLASATGHRFLDHRDNNALILDGIHIAYTVFHQSVGQAGAHRFDRVSELIFRERFGVRITGAFCRRRIVALGWSDDGNRTASNESGTLSCGPNRARACGTTQGRDGNRREGVSPSAHRLFVIHKFLLLSKAAGRT